MESHDRRQRIVTVAKEVLKTPSATDVDEIHSKSTFRRFLSIALFIVTRSCAVLRAADLDWIVGPEYSLGGYICQLIFFVFIFYLLDHSFAK